MTDADRVHPAAAAWCELHRGTTLPRRIEILREEEKSAVYRLDGVGGGRSCVIAKRCRVATGSLERIIYEEILPKLPLTTLRYYGFLQEDDEVAWLFLEDAGSQRFSPLVAEQRTIVGRWLALMHTSASSVGASATLPERGPRQYREHARAAGRNIRHALTNPALSGSDVELLVSVVGLCDDLDRRWDELEQCFEGAPATLVHGDFRPKNIHLRTIASQAVVYLFDWETAGWGLPAVDLAPSRGRTAARHVDLEAYASVAREYWPNLDSNVLGRFVAAGTILRRLTAMYWACTGLEFDDGGLTLARLGVYRSDLLEAMQAAHLA